MKDYEKSEADHDKIRVWFEVFLLNKDKTEYHLAANLSDPQLSDMFWYSYLIEPVSEEMDARLRDETVWNETKYMLQRAGNPIPAPTTTLDWTFSGGCKDFCERNTNRMSFRSLYPHTDEDASTWGLISSLGRGLRNLFKEIVWGPHKPLN